MEKYTVEIAYDGSLLYTVEAEDKVSAKRKALAAFHKDDDVRMNLATDLESIWVRDVWSNK